MNYSYAWQKFRDAVETLAGSLSYASRLYFAANDLRSPDVRHHLPDGLVQRWEAVVAELGTIPADGTDGRGPPEKRVSAEDFDRLAKEIVSIYDAICRRMGS